MVLYYDMLFGILMFIDRCNINCRIQLKIITNMTLKIKRINNYFGLYKCEALSL